MITCNHRRTDKWIVVFATGSIKITVRMLLLFLVVLTTGCGPSVKSAMLSSGPSISPTVEVQVIPLYKLIPEDAILLGSVKVGDTGFSMNCNYETVIERAKLEARKHGGNAIKLTKHVTPDILSSCHRIEASILSIPTRGTQ